MSDFIVASDEELEILTKRERQVYERHRHQGLKFKAIGKELKIKVVTVECHWKRALKKIKEFRVKRETPYDPPVL